MCLDTCNLVSGQHRAVIGSGQAVLGELFPHLTSASLGPTLWWPGEICPGPASAETRGLAPFLAWLPPAHSPVCMQCDEATRRKMGCGVFLPTVLCGSKWLPQTQGSAQGHGRAQCFCPTLVPRDLSHWDCRRGRWVGLLVLHPV